MQLPLKTPAPLGKAPARGATMRLAAAGGRSPSSPGAGKGGGRLRLLQARLRRARSLIHITYLYGLEPP